MRLGSFGNGGTSGFEGVIGFVDVNESVLWVFWTLVSNEFESLWLRPSTNVFVDAVRNEEDRDGGRIVGIGSFFLSVDNVLFTGTVVAGMAGVEKVSSEGAPKEFGALSKVGISSLVECGIVSRIELTSVVDAEEMDAGGNNEDFADILDFAPWVGGSASGNNVAESRASEMDTEEEGLAFLT